MLLIEDSKYRLSDLYSISNSHAIAHTWKFTGCITANFQVFVGLAHIILPSRSCSEYLTQPSRCHYGTVDNMNLETKLYVPGL